MGLFSRKEPKIASTTLDAMINGVDPRRTTSARQSAREMAQGRQTKPLMERGLRAAELHDAQVLNPPPVQETEIEEETTKPKPPHLLTPAKHLPTGGANRTRWHPEDE